ALALQLAAPRGSRETWLARLRHSGHAGLTVLLVAVVAIAALLVGLMAGPLLCLPFVLGVLLAGLPGAWPSGLRWSAVALTLSAVALIGLGALCGAVWPDAQAGRGPLAERAALTASRTTWADSARILSDFPLLGAGAGSFASIYPAFKTEDRTPTTAQSSLLQWAVETGGAGLALLALAGVWCLWRLPGAYQSVGTADRNLPCGLIGAAACFGLFALIHWSVELPAVALAASAVGGTLDRWLAGGTDLFV
ncbi:MAG TPA: O-antigen ligase domain-containing protein, partial [Isosphaeraceae bacterium]|nr:O-antigen ligase domain-containing protein [Isosphaeraceae bacterium]